MVVGVYPAPPYGPQPGYAPYPPQGMLSPNLFHVILDFLFYLQKIERKNLVIEYRIIEYGTFSIIVIWYLLCSGAERLNYLILSAKNRLLQRIIFYNIMIPPIFLI